MSKMQLTQVSFAYGNHGVIENLSLDIQPGLFHGIVGPNGAGKSTALKLLSGYLKPQKGQVLYNNLPLDSYPLRQLAKEIAWVPQSSQYFPFTVEEVVLLGRSPFYARLEKPDSHDLNIAKECMGATDILHLAKRPVNQLSGGEQQRVTLARAFAQRTQVLLLDEPTTHLDLEYQIRTCQLLREKASEGMTCVAVLHDLNLAANYCDYILVLHNGRLASQGIPQDAFTPKLLATIYNVSVPIMTNPLTGRPVVAP